MTARQDTRSADEEGWGSAGESSLSDRLEAGKHSALSTSSFEDDDDDDDNDIASSRSSQKSSSGLSSSSSSSSPSSASSSSSPLLTPLATQSQRKGKMIPTQEQNGHDRPKATSRSDAYMNVGGSTMPGRIFGYQIRNRRRSQQNGDVKLNGNNGNVNVNSNLNGASRAIQSNNNVRKRPQRRHQHHSQGQGQPQSIISLYKTSFRIITSKKSSTLLLFSILVWLYVQFHVAYHVQRGDVYSLHGGVGAAGTGRHNNQGLNNKGQGQSQSQIDKQLRDERRKSAFAALGSAAGDWLLGRNKKGKKHYNGKSRGSKDGYAPAADRLPKDCSLQKWQEASFPTCNDVHDLDLREVLRVQVYGYMKEWEKQYQSPLKNEPLLGRGHDKNHSLPFLSINSESSHKHGKKHVSKSGNDSTNADMNKKVDIGYVGSGLWRQVWKVQPRIKGVERENAVIKVMKSQHDVCPRNFDRHRRDAIVMERLTKSPHVVSIYGFCGNSVLTEFAGVTLDDYLFEGTSISNEHNRYNNKFDASGSVGSNPTNITFKIQLALDVMKGLKAMHDDDIAHADIQSKQFLLDPVDGIKVNDFNRCRFLPRHDTDNHVCKVKIPSAPGGKRSPEEYEMQKIDTKIDVFSAGNILYGILTGSKPFNDLTRTDMRGNVVKGIKPKIDETFRTVGTPDGDLAGIVDRSFEFDPDKRPSASQIILDLEALLVKYGKRES